MDKPWQFKKGQTPWNKGVHVENAGTFKKGHKVNLGRKFPAEFGEKTRQRQLGKAFQSGENHWNWRGGITEQDRLERLKFRHELQHKVFARDNYQCTLCESNGSLQVDHIKGWAQYPDLRFNITNCRTLCMSCHYYVTFKRKMPKGIIWGHNLSRRIAS